MSRQKTFSTMRAGVVALLAGAAGLSFLPSALAAGSDAGIARPSGTVSIAADGGLGAFTPASVDPRLLQRLRPAAAEDKQASGIFRFTPAGSRQAGRRAVTVAVRIDSETARAISFRESTIPGGDAGMRDMPGVAPVGFNLGIARGYQSFAPDHVESPVAGKSLVPPSDIHKLDMPDLSSFTPAGSSRSNRFSAVVDMEIDALPGAAPRTITGDGDVSVDVAGAYRVAKNLKVTAGLRYSAENDRLAPLTAEQQDSQAVYIGTQFRF
jgi:hypothetical protein